MAWDLRHLSAKYPWLQVNDATLVDFREPFEWRKAPRSRDEDKKPSLKPRRGVEAGRRVMMTQMRDVVTDAVVVKKNKMDVHVKDSLDLIVFDKRKMEPTGIVKAELWQTPKCDVKRKLNSSMQQNTSKKKTYGTLERTSKDLNDALHLVQKDESHIRNELMRQIDSSRATIPLQFLFERNMREYCLEKGAENIMKVFSKLINKYQYEGLRRWKYFMFEQRKIEAKRKVQERMQAHALAMFNRIAEGCIMGNIKTAFQKWVKSTKQGIFEERNQAAIRIQVHLKRRRDIKLLKQLKQARKEKMERDVALIIELLHLEATGYVQLWKIRHQANAIKRLREAEMILHTKSAIQMQRVYRGYRGRKFVHRLREQLKKDAEQREIQKLALFKLLNTKAIVIQCAIRVCLAKMHLHDLRMKRKIYNENALTIQQAWRTSKGKKVLLTRFARRKLTIEEKAERDRFHAKQRLMAEFEAKRQAAAVCIQRHCRGVLGRKIACKMRHAARLEAAVRRVQAAWRKSKGRFALHLRFLAQRERMEVRRLASAVKIQACMRRFLATKIVGILKHKRQVALKEAADKAALERRKQQSANTIQRVFRGFLARCDLFQRHRAATVIQCMLRQHWARRTYRQRKLERRQLYEKQTAAAIQIQRIVRGRQGRNHARARAEAKRIEAEKKRQSAERIQSRLRGNLSRTAIRTLNHAKELVLRQRKRSLRASKSRLEILLCSLESHDLSLTQVKELELAMEEAKKTMLYEDKQIIRIQCLWRGRKGRFTHHLLLKAKHERDALEYNCAVRIQCRVRGHQGRKAVEKIKQAQLFYETTLAYKRSIKAKEEKQKWIERLDMEKFKIQVEMERALDHKLKITRKEDELLRLETSVAAQKKAAEEAQKEEEKKQVQERAKQWKEMTDSFGYKYYLNQVTGETTWSVPLDILRLNEQVKSDVKSSGEDEDLSSKEDWEELYNPNTGQIYYHNRKTGETKWNSNPVPLAANVDTEKPKEEAAVESKPAPIEETKAIGATESQKCGRCKKQKAVKECLHCKMPNLYCTSCFSKEHKIVTHYEHDFKILNDDGSRECAMCQNCSQVDIKATYYCETCNPTKQYMCANCYQSLHATAETMKHKSIHFSAGASLCSQCIGEKLVAQRICHDCNDKFCISCFESLHAKGKKKEHNSKPLNVLKADLSENEVYCVECDVVAAVRLCNLCGDNFCCDCYDRVHSKGRKSEHTYILCKDAATAGDWIEIFDGNRKGNLYYNLATKETVDEKPSVLLLGLERHREMIAEALREKKKREIERESELVTLREKLRALEEEKELERRHREQQAILEDNPDMLETKPKRKWWKTKKQMEKEKKEREDKVVLSLMITKQRKEKLHQEAMQVGSAGYANTILNSVMPQTQGAPEK